MLYEIWDRISDYADSVPNNARLSIGTASVDAIPFMTGISVKLFESGQYGLAAAVFIANVSLGANAGYMLTKYADNYGD